jgi:hypothetical protein
VLPDAFDSIEGFKIGFDGRPTGSHFTGYSDGSRVIGTRASTCACRKLNPGILVM